MTGGCKLPGIETIGGPSALGRVFGSGMRGAWRAGGRVDGLDCDAVPVRGRLTSGNGTVDGVPCGVLCMLCSG